MFKRLSTVPLFGGLLGLVPATAEAAPVAPAEVVQPDPVPVAGYDLFHKDRDDDHYRCMYRCDDRHRYDKHHRHKYHHRHRYCWYRDRWGWYQARCGRHHRHHHH
ncbi:MAG: hypothetical protein ACRDYF_08610 [Acidimicrobiia bacterium]